MLKSATFIALRSPAPKYFPSADHNATLLGPMAAGCWDERADCGLLFVRVLEGRRGELDAVGGLLDCSPIWREMQRASVQLLREYEALVGRSEASLLPPYVPTLVPIVVSSRTVTALRGLLGGAATLRAPCAASAQ